MRTRAAVRQTPRELFMKRIDGITRKMVVAAFDPVESRQSWAKGSLSSSV
jgi:hypothetical protein